MLEHFYFYVAVAGGLVLGLQLLLTFLGGEEGGDFDDGGADAGLDFDGDGDGDGHHHGESFWFFEIVSIRTLAAAATFFGLVGLTARSADLSPPISLVLAAAAGFGAMYAVYWMFKQLLRLQSSGTQRVQNAVGLPAIVYLRIPEADSGAGKVHVDMQGRTVEYLAVTDDEQPIPTGENVMVTEVVNSETLRVARQI
ncbi:hypothetical protein NG895_13180 [Aeoliella sp. ICT_H6.2]|uniref:NfeD-like C-terminal domain-containing protein n=1 Tax=Aeoliella straminimaris TaxID=2954799 RepID=A0A9X2FAA9_9BACT|nr:hypothetical protein [Aeoliella straminimaris]MCO6044859.1 hypothetical protein [Aeoliella straminimaris]